ncbi:MAG: hypothetical protein L3V56_02990, partial [Candidatus Magnetoovum sp. WYHC-5]|nr:hypothetical protein [Candidatus Magnetoovum sp. WYHC-5]
MFSVSGSYLVISDRLFQNIETNENHDKVIQKVLRKLRGINLSSYEIVLSDSINNLNRQADKGIERIANISSFIKGLLEGGTIKDYTVDKATFIENVVVTPITDERKILLVQCMAKINALNGTFERLIDTKISFLKNGVYKQMDIEMVKDVDKDISDIIAILGDFTTVTANKNNTERGRIHNKFLVIAIIIITSSLLFAAILSAVYLTKLYRSIIKPIKIITSYFNNMSYGKSLISGEIEQLGEKGELGELFVQFQFFTEWFLNVNAFKKIIEDDYNVENIYYRLEQVFKNSLNIADLTMYEVNREKNYMSIIHRIPEDIKPYCNNIIQSNCIMCRAIKTGTIISSLEYDNICIQFEQPSDKYYYCVPLLMGGYAIALIQFVFEKEMKKENIEKINKTLNIAYNYI